MIAVITSPDFNPKDCSKNLNNAVTLLDNIERLIIASIGPDTDVTAEYLRKLDELKEDLVDDIVEFDRKQSELVGTALKAAAAAGFDLGVMYKQLEA